MKIKNIAEYAASGETPEILFWVGCAGSFDARAQKITIAFTKILDHLGIDFAILGNEESCTGDPARRAGNEFLFQMQALQNIQVLNMYAVNKIVTFCPHCYNTLKNEYPELGGEFEVMHHSQYLEQLIEEGKLSLGESGSQWGKVTYHDSCYLGRINGEYEAPRTILSSLRLDLVEMEQNRSKGLCCGAGGAQMFKEEEAGEKRVNDVRTKQAIDIGAKTIAANCPFCITMFSDGLKSHEKQDEIMVYDISEMIVQQKGW